jgi:hypothetical protein
MIWDGMSYYRVTRLQMVTVCYSHRYNGLPKSTPNVKCPRLRLYVLEASREGQEKVVEQVGRPGTPWDALGGPGVLNLSARQSQMLPDPDPEARRVACAVLSFVTSSDMELWHSKGWIPMVWPCGLLPWLASQHCSKLEAVSHQQKSPYLA